jgi:uncharacterized surface protein with fasciclin (FAS1) repeats
MKLAKIVRFSIALGIILFVAKPSLANECSNSSTEIQSDNSAISVGRRTLKANSHFYFNGDSRAVFTCTVTKRTAVKFAIPDDSRLQVVSFILYENGSKVRSGNIEPGRIISLNFNPNVTQDYRIEFKVESYNSSQDYMYILEQTEIAEREPEIKFPEARRRPKAIVRPNPSASITVFDLAQNSRQDFRILTAALESTGLSQTLSSQGSFTLFAPNDSAWDSLPGNMKSKLFKPENREILARVLKANIASGQFSSTDLTSSNTIGMMGGYLAEVKSFGSSIRINKSTIIRSGIQASNGIVHIIDQVIIPGDIMSWGLR